MGHPAEYPQGKPPRCSGLEAVGGHDLRRTFDEAREGRIGSFSDRQTSRKAVSKVEHGGGAIGSTWRNGPVRRVDPAGGRNGRGFRLASGFASI